MIDKSPKEGPFTGHIYERPWFSRVIEAQQTSVLSKIFDDKNKIMEKEVSKLTRETGKDYHDISSTLIPFLLEKNDDQRMLRIHRY